MLILVLNVFQEVDIFNKLTAKMIYVSNSTQERWKSSIVIQSYAQTLSVL